MHIMNHRRIPCEVIDIPACHESIARLLLLLEEEEVLAIIDALAKDSLHCSDPERDVFSAIAQRTGRGRGEIIDRVKYNNCIEQNPAARWFNQVKTRLIPTLGVRSQCGYAEALFHLCQNDLNRRRYLT